MFPSRAAFLLLDELMPQEGGARLESQLRPPAFPLYPDSKGSTSQTDWTEVHCHKVCSNSEDPSVLLEETPGRINPPWV